MLQVHCEMLNCPYGVIRARLTLPAHFLMLSWVNFFFFSGNAGAEMLLATSDMISAFHLEQIRSDNFNNQEDINININFSVLNL